MEQHEFAKCLPFYHWIIPSTVQGNNLSAGHLHSAWCWLCPWHTDLDQEVQLCLFKVNHRGIHCISLDKGTLTPWSTDQIQAVPKAWRVLSCWGRGREPAVWSYPQLSAERCPETGSQLRKYLLATVTAMRRNIFALYKDYLQRHLTSPFRFPCFVSVLWAKAACGCYQKSRWDLGASCVWFQFFAGKRKAVWKKRWVHAILVSVGLHCSFYEKLCNSDLICHSLCSMILSKNRATYIVPWCILTCLDWLAWSCSWFQVCRARRIPQGARGHGFFDENLEIYAGPSRGISLSFMNVCSKAWAPAAVGLSRFQKVIW